jgi:hypothetical protein
MTERNARLQPKIESKAQIMSAKLGNGRRLWMKDRHELKYAMYSGKISDWLLKGSDTCSPTTDGNTAKRVSV